jgi:hypothetical protein
MPCRYDPGPGDYPSQRELDELAEKACRLRAFILAHVDPTGLSGDDLKFYHKVKDEQYKHRAADLVRAVTEAQTAQRAVADKIRQIKNLGGTPGEKIMQEERVAKDRLASLLNASVEDHLSSYDLF